jgi:hypothetical protein
MHNPINVQEALLKRKIIKILISMAKQNFLVIRLANWDDRVAVGDQGKC